MITDASTNSKNGIRNKRDNSRQQSEISTSMNTLKTAALSNSENSMVVSSSFAPTSATVRTTSLLHRHSNKSAGSSNALDESVASTGTRGSRKGIRTASLLHRHSNKSTGSSNALDESVASTGTRGSRKGSNLEFLFLRRNASNTEDDCNSGIDNFSGHSSRVNRRKFQKDSVEDLDTQMESKFVGGSKSSVERRLQMEQYKVQSESQLRNSSRHVSELRDLTRQRSLSFLVHDTKTRIDNAENDLSLIRKSEKIPMISPTEIISGELVGTGSFGCVFAVKDIRLQKKSRRASMSFDKMKLNSDQMQSQEKTRTAFYLPFLNAAQGTISKYDGIELPADQLYVMKKPLNMRSREEQVNAVVDIVTELKLLNSLQHQHIIKLRAFSTRLLFSENFFLVFDRMQVMLPDRMNEWRKRKKAAKTFMNRVSKRSKDLFGELFFERLAAAWCIAKALKYLHEHNVIYRDLKPDNIGFDALGVLKLLDFGLAKQANIDECLSNGLYRLTPKAGSRRYMAPEVALGPFYNTKADVFSYGILLWELLTLKKPYGAMDFEDYVEKVAVGGLRPTIKRSRQWSEGIVNLLENSWTKDVSERLSFKDIIICLSTETQQRSLSLSANVVGKRLSLTRKYSLSCVEESSVRGDFEYQ